MRGEVVPSLEGRRITFFANVDWSFLSHRREIAAACVQRGAEVSLMAGDTGRLDEVSELGVTPVPLSMSRTGTGPIDEARAIAEIGWNLRQLDPEIQHNVSIKPVLYGTAASTVSHPPVVVNAVSGAGSMFDLQGILGGMRDLTCKVLRPLLRAKHVSWVFQNREDLELYQQRGLVRDDQWTLTMGSGVDLDRFRPTPLPETPTITFASRLIWTKGVGTFVEAAQIVRRKRPDARFVIAGDAEDSNAASVGREVVERWVADGHVEWRGVVDDMPALYEETQIFCLPSWYREGVPRVLLEAAACGRPAIASDIAGARRAIEHGRTGLMLDDPKDPEELARAILSLLDQPEDLQAMSSSAAAMAKNAFGVERVVEETLKLYGRALAPAANERRSVITA